MHIVSKNKIMDFNIISYQFPDHTPSGEDYDYDANWLTCEIKYSDGNINEVYRDSCLLTYEFQELIEAMEKILNNEEDAYISQFMEPYLHIAIARAEEKLVFTIQFVYDTTGGNWKERIISAVMDTEMAREVLDELLKFQKTYPER